MIKSVYALLIFVTIGTLTNAQEVIPLQSNPILRSYLAEQERELPKSLQYRGDQINRLACEVEREQYEYVFAGTTTPLPIEVDTVGLDTLPGTYTCLDCDAASFGTVNIVQDTLFYTANAGVEGGSEVFTIEFCNSNGCVTTMLQLIVRRANTTYTQPTVNLTSGQMIVPEIAVSNLPGPVTCRAIVDCDVSYEGQDQLTYFVGFSPTDSTFVYRASRYAGLDTVCLVLCDTFAVCDTFLYRYRISQDTLDLPFMDDFSYEGPFPNAVQWLDTDPFVNDHMSANPPSVGTASFDGLNNRGEPYGGEYGRSDRLTSNYLNLEDFINDEVYLSFWLQRKGNADRPEPQDSILLEFKNPDGEWEYIVGFEGAPISQPNTVIEPFFFHLEEIAEDFKFDGFQFRFTNFSNRTGILDNWHLDYVRVSDNISQADTTFSDLAFTAPPRTILDRYTSMPWRHFEGREEIELSDSIFAGVFNHFPETINATPSNVNLVEINTNVELFNATLFNFVNQESNIIPGVPVNKQYSLISDPSFPSVWADYLQIMQGPAFDNLDELEFRMEYSHGVSNQAADPGFDAVIRNDFVSGSTVFDNYFAYDDGTAEAGLIAQQGDQIAVRFTTSVPDTLRAIQFHIPHTTVDVSDQTFNILVWVGELDDTPEYEAIFEMPFYTDLFFDTLQGFTTYRLEDAAGELTPIGLPAGDFYVGWEQSSPCDGSMCIPIGYDRNTPQAKSFISRNLGSGFEPLSPFTLPGALMIRPIVGQETPGSTATRDITGQQFQAIIYPNPAKDLVHIRLEEVDYSDFQLQLFNPVGQLVLTDVASPQLDISSFPPGIYLLKLIDLKNQSYFSQKIIISQ